jgi:hypothetical protein
MPQLRPIALDFEQAAEELSEFRTFLEENTSFSETQVVKELRTRPHLSCLIGSLIAGVTRQCVQV